MMKHLQKVSPLFFLILAFSFLLPLAHASIPIYDRSVETDCSVSTCQSASVNTSAGDTIMVDVGCYSSSSNIGTVSDTLSTVFTNVNQITIQQSGASSQAIFTGTSSGGSDKVTVVCSSSFAPQFAFSVDIYSFVTGIGVTNKNFGSVASGTSSDTLTMIIQPNSFIYEGMTVSDANSNCPTDSGGSGQNIRANFGCGAIGGNRVNGLTMDKQYSNGGSTGSTASWTVVASSTSFTHLTVELLASGGSVTQVSNCYGNCGTPAVTRANTNSTKSINFNVTQTWFYENQVIFPALILNESASMACSVSTSQCPRATSITLGLWATQTNCIGAIPFSTSCPAILVASGQSINPQKGLFTITVNYPVFTGQWIAIGWTASAQGITINDTNTAVNIFNTQNFPASISSTASQGTSKANVYAWATGNTITGGGIIPSPTVCKNTDLACFEVEAICSLAPSNCMVGALVYLLIYWFVFFISTNLVVAYIDRETGMQLPIHPSLYVLVFVVIMAMETVLGVLPGWFTLLEFLIVSVLFGSFLSSMFSGSSHRGSRE